MTEQRNDPRRGPIAFATLAALVMIAVVVYVVLLLTAPTENASGQCSGIGFGCSLNPRDALLFAGFLFGLPCIVGTVILAALGIGAFVKWTRLPGIGIGILATIAAAAIVAVAAAIILYVI